MTGSIQQMALVLIAQAEGASEGPDLITSMLAPFLIVIGVLYFMVIRPAGKDRKDHQAMLDALKRGDEVVTSSGMLGKVTDIAENFVTVEVARNVKIRMLRSAIAKKHVEGKDPEAAKA